MGCVVSPLFRVPGSDALSQAGSVEWLVCLRIEKEGAVEIWDGCELGPPVKYCVFFSSKILTAWGFVGGRCYLNGGPRHQESVHKGIQCAAPGASVSLCWGNLSFFFSPCKFSLDVQRLRINMLKKQLSHNDLGIMWRGDLGSWSAPEQ